MKTKNNVLDILAKEVGSNYLDYRNKWRIAGERKNFYNVPLHLDVDLTNLCNMKCKNCNAPLYRIVGKKYFIDINILKKRLAESIPLGVKAVNFGNGSEPLLSARKLFDLVHYVKELGVIDVFLHTNGLLLNRGNNIKQIIESGITVLCVSLDACNENTYKKMGRKSFKRVVSNIMRFIEARAKLNSKLPILRLSFLPTQYNYKEAGEFEKFWQDKAEKIEVQRIFNVKKVKEIEKLLKKDAFNCIGPWRRLAIWPNNSYGACCQCFSFFKDSPLALGSLQEQSIEQAWNSKKMNNIRKQLKNNKLSKECFECTNNMYKLV